MEGAIPLLPHFTQVASGEMPWGERWSLQVWRQGPERVYEILEVQQDDGRLSGGGGGGPDLCDHEVLRISTGRADHGSYRVSGRVDPHIQSVLVEFYQPQVGHQSMLLKPVGDPEIFGMRFFATLLPRNTTITQVIARDVHGHEHRRQPREP